MVEVVSPSTFVIGTEAKEKLYANFGLEEFWLVFTDGKVFQIWTPQDNIYELYSSAEETETVESKVL